MLSLPSLEKNAMTAEVYALCGIAFGLAGLLSFAAMLGCGTGRLSHKDGKTAFIGLTMLYGIWAYGNRISSMALEKDEYLVFRTRVVRDKDGKIISANYGKIYGRMDAFRHFGYTCCFFNPVPNDTGLEEMEAYKIYKSHLDSAKR